MMREQREFNQSEQVVFLFLVAVFSKRSRKHILHVTIEF